MLAVDFNFVFEQVFFTVFVDQVVLCFHQDWVGIDGKQEVAIAMLLIKVEDKPCHQVGFPWTCRHVKKHMLRVRFNLCLGIVIISDSFILIGTQRMNQVPLNILWDFITLVLTEQIIFSLFSLIHKRKLTSVSRYFLCFCHASHPLHRNSCWRCNLHQRLSHGRFYRQFQSSYSKAHFYQGASQVDACFRQILPSNQS